MRIRLSDDDQKRFGCEEWLEFDLEKISAREAATIQKVLGFDDPMDMIGAWSDQFKIGEGPDGAKVLEKHRYDYDVWDAIVWLSLRHAGALTAGPADMQAELAGLDYQVVRIRLELVDDESGKAGTGSSSTPTPTSTD